MLKVTEIEVRYSGIPVIHNVSLEVKQGELVSVVGSNGAGKSHPSQNHRWGTSSHKGIDTV